MEEIEIENKLNIKVYFDSIPNFSLMPDDIKNLIISSLEEEIGNLKKKQNKNNN